MRVENERKQNCDFIVQYRLRPFPSDNLLFQKINRARARTGDKCRCFAHSNRDTMPDSFFATKSRKRKRVATVKDTGPSSSKKILKTSNGRTNAKGKARAADEDLHSDGSEVALEDMDLRADAVDPNESGDEDVGETPAEKRLRLAKLYLQSVREGLGVSLPHFLQHLVILLLVSLDD